MNTKPDYSGAAILCAGSKPMLRTVARRDDLVLANATPMIDEAERMSYFDQSARTVGGVVAEYVKPEPVQVARRVA